MLRTPGTLKSSKSACTVALNWRKCAPDCMQQASPVACLQGQVYLCIHASKINVTLTRAQRCLTVNSDGDFFKKDAVSRRWCEDPQNDVEAFPVLRNQPPAPALGKTSGAVSTALEVWCGGCGVKSPNGCDRYGTFWC